MRVVMSGKKLGRTQAGAVVWVIREDKAVQKSDPISCAIDCAENRIQKLAQSIAQVKANDVF